MIIIPALDIINGQAVRLSAGDYDRKTIYNTDCLSVARSFDDAGFKRLHLVDLDGAKNKKITNLKILEAIAAHTSLKIDFGGGVNTEQDVRSVLDAGAFQCTVGSKAAREPDVFVEWVEKFGAEKFLVGADVLNERIKISGWIEDAGISLFEFLDKMREIGLNEFFCTDISKDGMMHGPSVGLYRKIIQRYENIHLIASGGISGMEDIYELQDAGCSGAIVGKAIYEKSITLKELSEFQSSC